MTKKNISKIGVLAVGVWVGALSTQSNAAACEDTWQCASERFRDVSRTVWERYRRVVTEHLVDEPLPAGPRLGFSAIMPMSEAKESGATDETTDPQPIAPRRSPRRGAR